MGGNEPIKPVYPKGTVISVTISEGESLGAIAAKYNTSVQSIMKANGIENPNKVSAGRVITVNAVSDEELKKYNELKTLYDQHEAEKAEAKAVADRTKSASSKIQKANKDGYGEDYSFSINDKGHIIVTLKNQKKLGEISSDFGLKPGRLRATNPSIEQRYKPVTVHDHNGEDFETYDDVNAEEGHSFVIDTNEFSTERTWTQAIKDNTPQFIKNIYHKIF